MTRDRPDQLDLQVALKTNKFRIMTNEARVRLNMASFIRDYPIETAQTVYDREQ